MAVYLSTASADVSGASAEFTGALTASKDYVLTCKVDAWFRVGSAGGSAAVKGADSHFLKAGQERVVKTHESGLKVQIIKDTGESDGRASLSRVLLQ